MLCNKIPDLVSKRLIIFFGIGIGLLNGICIKSISVQIHSGDVKHVFQNADSDGDAEITDDLNGLCLSAACGFQISASVDQSLLFQKVQILADCGKSHLQILYDLHFGGLPVLINVLVNLGTVDLF